MTEKRQLQRESRQIAAADLFAVRQVAHLLARSPNTGRPVRLVGAAEWEDPLLLLLLETGLVSTYARVFAEGEYYTPIARKWVPVHLRDLHDSVLDRRDRYHAHTDRAEANIHRRNVKETPGSTTVTYPPILAKDELEGLAEIADTLRTRIAESLEVAPQADS